MVQDLVNRLAMSLFEREDSLQEELSMGWLLPICLFWTLIALYLGGFPVDVVGGNGFRQVMGIVDSYILFILLWALLRAVLGGLGGLIWTAVVPTILVTL